MPNSKENAWQEHLDARITKDTLFFDHDEVCDKTNSLPHTMPSLDVFTENMKKLGIPKDHLIVCYDNFGIATAPRAAWMFRFFGAKNVRILNGGLRKWVADGNATESGDQVKHGSGGSDGDFNYQVKD
jgi:thiosulfate/3-mercaptopyruvate sulfurtransferase